MHLHGNKNESLHLSGNKSSSLYDLTIHFDQLMKGTPTSAEPRRKHPGQVVRTDRWLPLPFTHCDWGRGVSMTGFWEVQFSGIKFDGLVLNDRDVFFALCVFKIQFTTTKKWKPWMKCIPNHMPQEKLLIPYSYYTRILQTFYTNTLQSRECAVRSTGWQHVLRQCDHFRAHVTQRLTFKLTHVTRQAKNTYHDTSTISTRFNSVQLCRTLIW